MSKSMKIIIWLVTIAKLQVNDQRKGNREDMCKIRKGAARSLRRNAVCIMNSWKQLAEMEVSVTSQADGKAFAKRRDNHAAFPIWEEDDHVQGGDPQP